MPLLVLWLTVGAGSSVAVNNFSQVNMTKGLAAFAAEHVAHALTSRGFKVVTQADIVATLGLERQRQLLGCGDDGACTAELTQALGVDYLLLGTLARLGESRQVNLKLLDARTGVTRATFSGATNDEADLPRVLSDGAAVLAAALPAPNVGTSHLGFNVAVGAGAAFVVAAGVCLGLAEDAHATLTTSPSSGVLDEATARAVRDRGQLTQVLSPIFFGAGAAIVATAFVLRFVIGADVPVSASIGPSGGVLVLGGRF